MAKIKDPETDAQIHHGRREKLRASFVKYGLESFNETQVLEFALGLSIPRIDTNPVAHRLINRFGSLNGVIDAHPDKLCEVGGVGNQSAFFLSFLKQFVTYYIARQKPLAKIKAPKDAVVHLREVMRTYTAEQFILLCLDKTGAIILQETITDGDINKVDINLKTIVDTALRVKTASAIIAHNHLDENIIPSDADMELTRVLVNILSPLGIDLMDHIIFGSDGRFYSFAAKGVINIFKREHKSFFTSHDYEDFLYAKLNRGDTN